MSISSSSATGSHSDGDLLQGEQLLPDSESIQSIPPPKASDGLSTADIFQRLLKAGKTPRAELILDALQKNHRYQAYLHHQLKRIEQLSEVNDEKRRVIHRLLTHINSTHNDKNIQHLQQERDKIPQRVIFASNWFIDDVGQLPGRNVDTDHYIRIYQQYEHQYATLGTVHRTPVTALQFYSTNTIKTSQLMVPPRERELLSSFSQQTRSRPTLKSPSEENTLPIHSPTPSIAGHPSPGEIFALNCSYNHAIPRFTFHSPGFSEKEHTALWRSIVYASMQFHEEMYQYLTFLRDQHRFLSTPVSLQNTLAAEDPELPALPTSIMSNSTLNLSYMTSLRLPYLDLLPTTFLQFSQQSASSSSQSDGEDGEVYFHLDSPNDIIKSLSIQAIPPQVSADGPISLQHEDIRPSRPFFNPFDLDDLRHMLIVYLSLGLVDPTTMQPTKAVSDEVLSALKEKLSVPEYEHVESILYQTSSEPGSSNTMTTTTTTTTSPTITEGHPKIPLPMLFSHCPPAWPVVSYHRQYHQHQHRLLPAVLFDETVESASKNDLSPPPTSFLISSRAAESMNFSTYRYNSVIVDDHSDNLGLIYRDSAELWYEIFHISYPFPKIPLHHLNYVHLAQHYVRSAKTSWQCYLHALNLHFPEINDDILTRLAVFCYDYNHKQALAAAFLITPASNTGKKSKKNQPPPGPLLPSSHFGVDVTPPDGVPLQSCHIKDSDLLHIITHPLESPIAVNMSSTLNFHLITSLYNRAIRLTSDKSTKKPESRSNIGGSSRKKRDLALGASLDDELERHQSMHDESSDDTASTRFTQSDTESDTDGDGNDDNDDPIDGSHGNASTQTSRKARRVKDKEPNLLSSRTRNALSQSTISIQKTPSLFNLLRHYKLYIHPKLAKTCQHVLITPAFQPAPPSSSRRKTPHSHANSSAEPANAIVAQCHHAYTTIPPTLIHQSDDNDVVTVPSDLLPRLSSIGVDICSTRINPVDFRNAPLRQPTPSERAHKQSILESLASQHLHSYAYKVHPAMYSSLSHPQTVYQDRLLLLFIKAFGSKDWARILRDLPFPRTKFYLYNRYFNTLDPSVKTGRWTLEEDLRLVLAVKAYTRVTPVVSPSTQDQQDSSATPASPALTPEITVSWIEVAAHVPGRSEAKCRERYSALIKSDAPDVQQRGTPAAYTGPTPTTVEDLEALVKDHGPLPFQPSLLLLLVRHHGYKWSVIASHFSDIDGRAVKTQFLRHASPEEVEAYQDSLKSRRKAN